VCKIICNWFLIIFVLHTLKVVINIFLYEDVEEKKKKWEFVAETIVFSRIFFFSLYFTPIFLL
jgi:hypothetical protein